MQIQISEELLFDTGKEVLEGLAFMVVTPGIDFGMDAADSINATVHFTGAFSGTFTVVAPEGILQELACNMLGMEDGEPCSEQQELDALGELGNVICGNLTRAMAGPEPVFNLERPVISRNPEVLNASPEGGRTVSARLPLEGGSVMLKIHLETADVAG